MKTITHDLIILGSGLRAALEAVRISGGQPGIAPVSRVQLLRTHSAAAERGTGVVLCNS